MNIYFNEWTVWAVIALSPTLSNAANPNWDIVPFTPGSDRVSILVDTNPVAPGYAVYKGELPIAFRSADGRILASNVMSIIQSGGYLKSGYVYQIDLIHGVPNAVQVELGMMTFGIDEVGSKADKETRKQVSTKGRTKISALPQQIIGLPQKPILSDQQRRCNHYASESVGKQKENSRRNCGLERDSTWTATYKDYYEWCIGAAPELIQSVLDRKDQQLRSCRP